MRITFNRPKYGLLTIKIGDKQLIISKDRYHKMLLKSDNIKRDIVELMISK